MIVKLRLVKKIDWKFILEIRNQDDVRFACHDTSKISMKTHEEYMEKHENNPKSYFWIITFDDKMVGFCKIIDEELGYGIKDGFRGKGIGSKTLSIVFDMAKNLGLEKIKGIIKSDQVIPLKVAEKAGFVKIGTIKKNKKTYSYILEKSLK